MDSLLGYAQAHCDVPRDDYCSQNSPLIPVIVRIRGLSQLAGLRSTAIETIGGNAEKVADYEPLEMRIGRIAHRIGESGQRVNFFDAFITLGRAPNNDIVTPNTAVSTSHVFFYNETQGIYVEDRESTNGSVIIDLAGQRAPLQPKVKTLLADGVALETGGEQAGDRYLFFSDPGPLYDFVKQQVARSTGR